MMHDALVFFAGLLVGWNVLPQPAWAKALYDRLRATVKLLVGLFRQK